MTRTLPSYVLATLLTSDKTRLAHCMMGMHSSRPHANTSRSLDVAIVQASRTMSLMTAFEEDDPTWWISGVISGNEVGQSLRVGDNWVNLMWLPCHLYFGHFFLIPFVGKYVPVSSSICSVSLTQRAICTSNT